MVSIADIKDIIFRRIIDPAEIERIWAELDANPECEAALYCRAYQTLGNQPLEEQVKHLVPVDDSPIEEAKVEIPQMIQPKVDHSGGLKSIIAGVRKSGPTPNRGLLSGCA